MLLFLILLHIVFDTLALNLSFDTVHCLYADQVPHVNVLSKMDLISEEQRADIERFDDSSGAPPLKGLSTTHLLHTMS